MYLGRPTLEALSLFIRGYETCLLFRGVNQEEEPDMYGFYLFLLGVYDKTGNSFGWRGLIVNHCQKDDELALAEFFKLYDRFQALRENNNAEWVTDA